MQTISLISELKVGWPPNALATFKWTAALGISFDIGVARPECMVSDARRWSRGYWARGGEGEMA